MIKLHFTPKTYIARSIFALTCVTYKKLVPSMSWEVIEFFSKLFIRGRPLLNSSQVGVIKYLLLFSYSSSNLKVRYRM